MTENKRAAAQEMMAWHFGRQRDTAWAGLDAPERRIMEAFGIGLVVLIIFTTVASQS